MASKSERTTTIEWTDHTFNPWIGCQRVDEGCRHCYADGLARRHAAGWMKAGWTLVGEQDRPLWGPGPRLFAPESYWERPLRWNRQAERLGERSRVFCASMADVLEAHGAEAVAAWQDMARGKLFDLITRTPWLDWQLLTKRPKNARDMAPARWWRDGFPENSMVGTSIAKWNHVERLDELVEIPARRFVSLEPLLGPIDIGLWLARLHWVIVGAESGAGARSMDERWVAPIKDACVAMGVPFFYKQQLEGRRKVSLPVLAGQQWIQTP